jgi:hypothetical protein
MAIDAKPLALEKSETSPASTRRSVLKSAAVAVAAGAGAATLGAPFISNPAKAQTTTWRI